MNNNFDHQFNETQKSITRIAIVGIVVAAGMFMGALALVYHMFHVVVNVVK